MINASEPPSSIIAMFTASTLSADSDLESSPEAGGDAEERGGRDRRHRDRDSDRRARARLDREHARDAGGEKATEERLGFDVLHACEASPTS